MRSMIAGFLVVLFCSTSYCRQRDPLQGAAARPAAPSYPVTVSNPVLSVRAQDMRAAVAAIYRLTPDRRFLGAFAALDALLTGRERQEAVARFAGGAWHIEYRGREIGVVPELPTYSDFIPLLTRLAKELATAAPLSNGPLSGGRDIEAEIDRFDTPDTLDALRRLNAEWKRSRPSTALPLASRALVSLVVRQTDTMEVGDGLGAQAIAVTAASKALSSDSGRAAEILLAGALHYDNDAEVLAKDEPLESPLRAWATGTLQDAGGALDSSRLLRFLEMRRLAETDDEGEWVKCIGRRPEDFRLLDIVAAGLVSGRFGAHGNASEIMPAVAWAEVAVEGGDAAPVLHRILTPSLDLADVSASYGEIARIVDAHRSTLGDEFERVLDQTAKRFSGPLFGADDYRSFYRAFFYSGIYGYGLHELDWLGSSDAARAFRRDLGNPADPLAAEYVRWFELLVQREAHAADDARVIAEMRSMDRLRQPAVLRTLSAVAVGAEYSKAVDLEAARLLFRHSDTRPSHRNAAADAARTTLRDLPLFERLYASSIRDAGHSGLGSREWLAEAGNDLATLREVLEDRRSSTAARLAAGQALLEAKAIDETAYRAVAMTALSGNPRLAVVQKYAMHLVSAGDTEEARRVLQKWMSTHTDADLLEISDARLALARSYEHEGNIRAALDALTPALPVWKQNAITQAALYLYAVGDHEKALNLARSDVERYPDVAQARFALAEICWREGKSEEAASVLSEGHLNSWDWRDAGGRFVTVFESQSDEAAATAFEPLERAVNAFALEQFVGSITTSGRLSLAFRLGSRLRYPGMGQLDLTTTAYKTLKSWKGADEALAWLRQTIPPPAHNLASDILYGQREYAPLWTLIDDPEKGKFPEFVWLMRAAAASVSTKEREMHQSQLLEYFKTTQRTDDYTVIGKYLVGLADENQAFSIATTPQRRCEIAYYAGVKALGQQRYREASDWFRVACETGQTTQGEFRWAKDQLVRWAGGQKTFDRAVREH